jgi:gamma-glutamylcyclotransferase
LLCYFAYGSNMLHQRLRARVPSAEPLAIGELDGYRLAWHKVGRDGSGKCDVVSVPDPAAIVHGVLYEIAAEHKPALDAAEGLHRGYALEWFSVRAGGVERQAFAYVATHVDPALQPYSWYHALVVAGARQHGLPASYLQRLHAVPHREDDDAARHAEHMALTRMPDPGRSLRP